MSIEEGDAKARELSVNFIETSAKAGLNIKVREEEGVGRGEGRAGGAAVLEFPPVRCCATLWGYYCCCTLPLLSA